MNISIVGAGYVGLVTGVSLAEIGHNVVCIDTNKEKIEMLKIFKSPIYEPELEELISKNVKEGRLSFTHSYEEGFNNSNVIFIAVGTPSKENGKADLSAIENVASHISNFIKSNVIVVIKSTVPVGTNEYIKELLDKTNNSRFTIDIVSNPEFLREGSAINDIFNGDRIIIGAENNKASRVVEELYKPFNIPIFTTSIRSAEMIKYASNAFLATKISFINEISNLCEKLGANIDDVAIGMGKDKRIGNSFLNAGIGYGGSCFPKDTSALVQIAGNVDHNFMLLKSVIEVNKKQQMSLIEKAKKRFTSLKDLKIALLGLSFKPNTDDIRDAASIVISEELLNLGATVTAYDPVATKQAKKILNKNIYFTDSIEDAIKKANCVFILTEWEEIKKFDLSKLTELMIEPIVFDGRNCFTINQVSAHIIEYHSMGKESVINLN